MKKTVYISGPISDPQTSQPRDGWQKDFLEAEAKLRGMGFNVINPVEIAKEVEKEWNTILSDRWTRRTLAVRSEQPPRSLYLYGCITELQNGILYGWQKETNSNERVTLHGIYVIGDTDQIEQSYGTMCEINFALSASLPVYSQYYHGYQINNRLRQLTAKPTLAEVANENE